MLSRRLASSPHMLSLLGAALLRLQRLLRQHPPPTPHEGAAVASVVVSAGTAASLHHHCPRRRARPPTPRLLPAPTLGRVSSRPGPCPGAHRALASSGLVLARLINRPCSRLPHRTAPATALRVVSLLGTAPRSPATALRAPAPPPPRCSSHGTCSRCRPRFTASWLGLRRPALPRSGT